MTAKQRKEMKWFHVKLQIWAIIFFIPIWFMFHDAEVRGEMVHTNWFVGFFFVISFIWTFAIPMYKLIREDCRRRHLRIVK